MTKQHHPVDAPEYYIFPSGVETIEVSENLTSLGGQIVQYVVRSTRIDGKNKGKRVEDLEKAEKLLQRELRRVKLEEAKAERGYCPTPKKKSYLNNHDAEWALKMIWGDPTSTGRLPIRAYRCPCGLYHLSSKAEREARHVA